MRRRLTTVYAVLCTLLFAAGFVAVFYFAWQKGVDEGISALAYFAVSLFLAPFIHELGHACFASAANMQILYCKFFCFKIYRKKGKLKVGFASPFAPEQTQVIPKSGGHMKKRASAYTLGGLIFSGVFLALILTPAIWLACIGHFKGSLFGLVPYTGYLFLLNILPVEYAGGKTDTLVFRGIKKGYDTEKVMLSAMEIQGELYAGKSFAEIDEGLYFDLPQLCEDEPLFAVILDLRYRYFLEKEEYEKAADCLNRLAQAQAYLTDSEVEKIAAELTYMHALRGDLESAEESGKLCRGFLTEDTATAKRVLLAYSKLVGKTEAIEPLLQQAKDCLQWEIAGVAKAEGILLSRIENN
ncbi:MAG: hypothetical protein IKB20_00350 [Clostridia bacterium]|nr:hypothetical protein [Clostridia bacterium]